LQWGSNADVSRGDGITVDESFPFEVAMQSLIYDASSFYEVEYNVDTSKWSANVDQE
jgi:hypothetical protein